MSSKTKTPNPSENELLLELDALRQALLQQARSFGHNSDNSLAIVRFFNGVDLKTWNKISKEHNLELWLPLELDKTSQQGLDFLCRQLESLAFQKDHDPLTNLPNRRLFSQNLEAELQRQERCQSDLSLVILDLDHFKQVNDNYGHACGDEVLKTLAYNLTSLKRPYDVACRLGGEEFALLLPGASALRAKAIVQRILFVMREHTFSSPDGAKNFKVTFSAGIAHLKGGDICKAEQLLELADSAMYKAKNLGRNNIVAEIASQNSQPENSMVQSDEKLFLFFGTSQSAPAFDSGKSCDA